MEGLGPDHPGKTLAGADNADSKAPVVFKPAADVGGQGRKKGRAAEEAQHPPIDEVKLKRVGGIAGEDAAKADHAGPDNRRDSHATPVEAPAHEDAANAGAGILQRIGDRGHGARPAEFQRDGLQGNDDKIDAARTDQHEQQRGDENDGPSTHGGIGEGAQHCFLRTRLFGGELFFGRGFLHPLQLLPAEIAGEPVIVEIEDGPVAGEQILGVFERGGLVVHHAIGLIKEVAGFKYGVAHLQLAGENKDLRRRQMLHRLSSLQNQY